MSCVITKANRFPSGHPFQSFGGVAALSSIGQRSPWVRQLDAGTGPPQGDLQPAREERLYLVVGSFNTGMMFGYAYPMCR